MSSIDNPEFDRAPLNPSSSDKSYNQLADQATFLANYLGSSSNGAGRRLAGLRESFLAMVASAPPSGADDYDDARYWLRRAIPDPAIDSDDNAQFQKDPTRNAGLITDYLVATNLEELPQQQNDHTASDNTGSHSLAPFTVVQVFAFPDGTNPLKKNYYFVRSTKVRVRLTGTRPGKGFYTANFVALPTATIDTNSDLTDTMLGADGPECYVANSREADAGTHDLSAADAPKVFIAYPLGQDVDGTTIMFIESDQSEDCS